MKTISDKGIILRRLEYGEADRIVTFLTKDSGKIRAMAKGVRKSKSKLAGGIELFSVSELHFIKGRGDIDTLMSTRLINHYENIVKKLERTEVAYHMLKTIDKIVEDGQGQEYFLVLNESLAALDNTAISQILGELSFLSRVLSLAGHLPDFALDHKGKKLDEGARYQFDYETVSFVSHPEGAYDKNHIKLVKLLSNNSPQAVAAIQDVAKYCQDLAPVIKGLAANYLNQ